MYTCVYYKSPEPGLNQRPKDHTSKCQLGAYTTVTTVWCVKLGTLQGSPKSSECFIAKALECAWLMYGRLNTEGVLSVCCVECSVDWSQRTGVPCSAGLGDAVRDNAVWVLCCRCWRPGGLANQSVCVVVMLKTWGREWLYFFKIVQLLEVTTCKSPEPGLNQRPKDHTSKCQSGAYTARPPYSTIFYNQGYQWTINPYYFLCIYAIKFMW